MTGRGSALAGALLLALARTATLSAQASWHGTLMGQAIGAIDHVDPTPGGGSLTEARVVQPVLMGLANGWNHHVLLTATLDLEGLTMPGGELAPGDWGEGFVDRRHPHTYAHELIAAWVDPLGKLDGAGRLGLVLGKGFVPFGSDDPMSRPFLRYPVNHHLSQLLERAVGIVQYDLGPVTLEGSLFNGDEPTKASDWPLLYASGEGWRFGDSHSARLTVRPIAGLEVQGSLAHVHSPESRTGAGPDDNKQSLSARFDRVNGTTERYALLEWARTSEAGGFFVFHTVLGEAMMAHRGVRVSYRFERTERPEEQRLLDPFRALRPDPDLGLLGVSRWTLHTLHVAVDLRQPIRGLLLAPFGEVTLGSVHGVGGGVFDPVAFYGGTGVHTLSVGVTASVGMRGHRMGRYGVLAGDMAGMTM
ncbi:MAG TPA: hypothetical protein VGM77_08705 [Gemmatimonadales bacterium]